MHGLTYPVKKDHPVYLPLLIRAGGRRNSLFLFSFEVGSCQSILLSKVDGVAMVSPQMV